MSQKAPAETVFLRNSSGVIRAMSPTDGVFFGYLSAAGLYGLVFYMFLGPGLFPRANFLMADVLTVVLFLAVYCVYAVLGSAMPRSGGDYVFQTRVFGPGFGFTISIAAFVVWGWWFCYLAASSILAGLIAPMFNVIGVSTGNHAWVTAAEYVSKTSVRIPIIMALILGSGWIMSRGLKPFLRIQRYFMMPASILGVVLIAASLLFFSHATFMSHLATFQHQVGGLAPSQVISKARSLGFNPAQGYSLADTVGMAVFLSFLFIWVCEVPSLTFGELKSAGRLKTVFGMFATAGALMFVTFLIGLVWTYSYVGLPFMRAFSWMVVNQPDTLGGDWGFRGAPTFLYIPSLNIWIAVLLFICFLGATSQSLFNTIIGPSRMLLAMSFDRLLPEWMGKVNKKGAPYAAIWLGIGVAVALTVVFEVLPNIAEVLFWSSFASLAGVTLTVIAGTIFPWRMKDVYEVSPASQYRLGGIPLVTAIGIIGTAFMLTMSLTNLFNSTFGLFGTGAARVGLVFAVALILVAAIGYVGAKWYRRSTGIDILLNFAAVPPE